MLKICFHNDDRSLDVPKEIIMKYDKSMIYGYVNCNNIDKITLDNINYDTFKCVYDVIIDNTNRCDAGIMTKALLNYYGFHDDIDDSLIILFDKKENMINKFINSHKKIFVPNSIHEYEELKHIFTKSNNIIPIQKIGDSNTEFICVFDGIPLYYKTYDFNTKQFCNVYININNNINIMRKELLYHILIKTSKWFKETIGEKKNVIMNYYENEFGNGLYSANHINFIEYLLKFYLVIMHDVMDMFKTKTSNNEQMRVINMTSNIHKIITENRLDIVNVMDNVNCDRDEYFYDNMLFNDSRTSKMHVYGLVDDSIVHKNANFYFISI